ncbi:MAG: arginine deiminase-related protein [Bacteroidota bacterium]
MNRALTNHILMVRPAHFGYNEETADDNAFQARDENMNTTEVQEEAVREFDTLIAKLRAADIDVFLVNDADDPYTPDAVFPNNWVSFHQNGTIATYPMYSSIRRRERQEEIIQMVKEKFGFDKRMHFEQLEFEDKFLEGTGSLVLDRLNKIAFACKSHRTHEDAVDQFCKYMNYEKVLFSAYDEPGKPIYHTNVMMTMGDHFAIVCMESIKNERERLALQTKLADNDKTIIEISFEQMGKFAGNTLLVNNNHEESYLVMSSSAYHAFDERQLKILERFAKIIHSPIPTIEKSSGGSVRCMMAEIFVP